MNLICTLEMVKLKPKSKINYFDSYIKKHITCWHRVIDISAQFIFLFIDVDKNYSQC